MVVVNNREEVVTLDACVSLGENRRTLREIPVTVEVLGKIDRLYDPDEISKGIRIERASPALGTYSGVRAEVYYKAVGRTSACIIIRDHNDRELKCKLLKLWEADEDQGKVIIDAKE